MTADTGSSKWFVAYLMFTAVICGALVMVVEVLGSRVIGPFFGVSLFVWTSLISVTLIALAAGYGIGGVLSDRWAKPAYLFGIILAAGFLVLLIPLLKGPVLKACLSLGLRAGAFASTLILFGPALFLLGCVSPYLVKIIARELHNIGRVVGGLYALSTFGSILGTVLTGFVLIAYLGVDQIFAVIGSLLTGLAVGYFVLFQRRWLALGFLVVPFLLFHSGTANSRIMPNGTRVEQVYSRDSFYGSLKVVDYSRGARHTRELIIDGLIQGGVDMRNGLSIYSYSYFVQFLSYLMNPAGKDCLVIGLGAGVVPRWFESQGIRADVVDIDPAVVEIAQKYFGFSPGGDVILADARYFLGSAKKKYDYIILDVFNGDITPGHVVSVEALRLVAQRLRSGGIVAINLVGSLRGDTFMTASVVKTLQAVFDQVDIYPTFDVHRGDGSGNLVLTAYQGPRRPFDARAIVRFAVHDWVIEDVFTNLGRRFEFGANTPAIILTDNYNPIDFYDTRLREKVRRGILQNTDWDILIKPAG